MGFHRVKLENESEMYEYAIRALGRRMRSVAELKRLLRRRIEPGTEIGQVMVELVTRRLKDQGYLNDSKYAVAYSVFRRDNEKFGPRRVTLDLKAKGIHGEVIEQAVDSAFAEVNEEKQAREYLRRKHLEKPKDQKQTGRVFRQLSRAGFRRETIFKILRRWEIDEEVLESLEAESVENDL